MPDNNTNGFGNSLSAGIAYPIVRGLDVNWKTGLNAVGVVTNSETMGTTTQNKTLTMGQWFLDGNSGDRSIQLGENVWFWRSALNAGSIKNDAPGASTQNPGLVGDTYTKFSFMGVSKIFLSKAENIYAVVNVRGQAANTNLDPYEKLMVGGASALRGYSPDTAGSLNQGTISTFELRKTFNTGWGEITPLVFMDYANGWINKATYPNWQINSGYSNANLSNHLVLADAGLGFEWSSYRNWTLVTSWATRLPSSPVMQGSSGNSQFWFLAQTFL